MGPSRIEPEKPFDIGPHPHIGLSTLTYLLEGEIVHRDSLGTVQRIRPNEVNWMTAGRGITHSERVPDDMRSEPFTLHGYQVWVALPKEIEKTDPSFSHHGKDELPVWTEGTLELRLIAGSFDGRRSPVPVFSDLYMLEVKAEEDLRWDLAALYGEKAICVVEGRVSAEGETFQKGTFLVAKPGEVCNLRVEKGAHLLVFGGEPLEEERFIWWNFVASDQAIIEEAKADWANDTFPRIPGEGDRIPLPL
jgi:hypothetical protein